MAGRRALALAALVTLCAAGCGHVRRASSPAPATTTTAPARTTIVVRKRHTRIVPGAHHEPIPILMYHVINAAPPGTPNPDLWVPADAFAAQMRALEAAGYHGVTLGQVWDHWQRGVALPARPVVVTFDDGYLSDYTNARPVLAALHWPGVLNLVLHNLGPGGLTKYEVRALLADGWELDSHTIDHVDLTTLDAAALRHELAGSRTRLRHLFGVPVRFFCYPSGRFDPAVEAAVRRAGYEAATTTQPGLARPGRPYELARIRVDATDTAATLLAKLGT
jgi:peptidoglycan/xylan/chitin deacetylase (PgdA/CDA1 family)